MDICLVTMYTLLYMGSLKNQVQQFRYKAEMTQEVLAEKVRVSRQTIIAIEKGNYAPSIVLALRLAKILKTSVETLFTLP